MTALLHAGSDLSAPSPPGGGRGWGEGGARSASGAAITASDSPHIFAPPPEVVAASLLTSPAGSELHLVTRDGGRLRVTADDETARTLAVTLWRALDAAR